MGNAASVAARAKAERVQSQQGLDNELYEKKRVFTSAAERQMLAEFEEKLDAFQR